MGFFKKKQKIFGESIEPSCDYCRYNRGEDEIICANKTEDFKPCKNYEYEPTMRKPMAKPKMKKFDEEDFSL